MTAIYTHTSSSTNFQCIVLVTYLLIERYGIVHKYAHHHL